MYRFVTAFTLFLTLFAALSVPTTWAQDFAGVGVTPPFIEEKGDPGNVIADAITVSNLTNEDQTYYIYVRDIRGVRGAGEPVFAEEGMEKTGYELSNWVTLGQSELILGPGGEATVPVSIAVPGDAAPGSHFGGIFVSVEPPELDRVGASVGYEVVSIVSIRVAGDALESANIRTLSTDRLIYGTPEVTFLARVENKGNVLVKPVGPLEIYDMFGRQAGSLVVNESQGAVFPKSVRDYQAVWEDTALRFGRYEAVLSMVYGENGVSQNTITQGVTFWIMPWELIKPALIILGGLLLATFVGVKLYLRGKLRSVQGGRRLNRRYTQSNSSLKMLLLVMMLVVTALFLLVLLVLFA